MPMLELEYYLNYCDSQYQNSNPTQCGETCNNKNYCQGQEVDCYNCIKRVHNYKNCTVHYNCPKMMYNYVLKHSYRFAAEVYYEVLRLQRVLSQWNEVYYTSIGCGPCTELFGLLQNWRNLGKGDDSFHFNGFDNEPMWKSLMDYVETLFSSQDVHTHDVDVFQYYQESHWRVDILVLNYMLSDMFKFKTGLYTAFLLSLCDLIKEMRPQFLLINDVYLKDSMTAMNRLLQALKSQGIGYRSQRVQYHYEHPFIGLNGQRIDRRNFGMSNQTIVEKYIPFSYVDSMQTIVKFI